MKPMPFPAPPPESLALTTLRRARGLTGTELADLAGMTKGKLSRYEMGTDVLHREKLDELASVMGYDPADVDSMTFGILGAITRPGKVTRSPVDPTPDERRRFRQVLGRLAQAEREGLETQFIQHLRDSRAKRDRSNAEDLVQLLLEEPDPRARQKLVESSRKFHNWAVAERLSSESAKAAADNAAAALEIARLAIRASELAPGDPEWRQRLEGYVWLFVANARRVSGDLPSADQAFAKASLMWEAGSSADPGLLAEWRLPDLMSALRRAQGRYEDALALHERALSLAPSEVKGRILLKKALTLEQMGKYELALPVLRDAVHLVDGRDDPRLLTVLRFDLIVVLCGLGRFEEAEAALDEVSAMTTALGNELDLVRLVWLRGRINAGLDRDQEAEAALEQARQAFRHRGIIYDFAKVTLELAVLYRSRGRLAEVKTLARQTLWVFQEQGVHAEAEKALRLFCEAVEEERLTAEFARRILTQLEKLQISPDVCFAEV